LKKSPQKMRSVALSIGLICLPLVACAQIPVDSQRADIPVLFKQKVEFGNVREIAEHSDGRFALVENPKIEFKQSFTHEYGGEYTRSVRVIGNVARVFPDDTMDFMGQVTAQFGSRYRFSSDRLTISNNGTKLVSSSPLTIDIGLDGQRNSNLASKGTAESIQTMAAPPEDGGNLEDFLAIEKNKYSCSGGNLFKGANKVPGNRVVIPFKSFCYTNIVTIECAGNNLTVEHTEIFNGCLGG